MQSSRFPTDVNAEGIFRISGSKKRQDELKHLLDKDMEINFEKDAFTEHDVASILKYFLAELPEPIVTSAHVKVHMQVAGKPASCRNIKPMSKCCQYARLKMSFHIMPLLPTGHFRKTRWGLFDTDFSSVHLTIA